MDHLDLHKELTSILEALQRQINFVNIAAIDHGVQIYAMKSTDGSFMLAPLLVAKTNALVALVQLEQASRKEQQRDPMGWPKNSGV